MTQEEQINDLNETVKVKLGASKIEGIGVFAMRDIAKGQRLYCFPNKQQVWYNIPYGSLSKLLPEVKDLILQQWSSIVNGSAFRSPNDTTWFILYINHSDEPNYDPRTDTVIKDIKGGEEITEDYKRMDNWQKIFPWLTQEKGV